MKCWGHNAYGQLGDGTEHEPFDAHIRTGSRVRGGSGRSRPMATPVTHGSGRLAVRRGLNQSGQLGDGTTTNPSGPVGVSSLSSGVVAISAGADQHVP